MRHAKRSAVDHMHTVAVVDKNGGTVTILILCHPRLDSSQWVQPPRRRKSPRQRSKRANGKNAVSKGKGKGKPVEDVPQFGPPPLPATSVGQQLWGAALDSFPDQL